MDFYDIFCGVKRIEKDLSWNKFIYYYDYYYCYYYIIIIVIIIIIITFTSSVQKSLVDAASFDTYNICTQNSEC